MRIFQSILTTITILREKKLLWMYSWNGQLCACLSFAERMPIEISGNLFLNSEVISWNHYRSGTRFKTLAPSFINACIVYISESSIRQITSRNSYFISSLIKFWLGVYLILADTWMVVNQINHKHEISLKLVNYIPKCDVRFESSSKYR